VQVALCHDAGVATFGDLYRHVNIASDQYSDFQRERIIAWCGRQVIMGVKTGPGHASELSAVFRRADLSKIDHAAVTLHSLLMEREGYSRSLRVGDTLDGWLQNQSLHWLEGDWTDFGPIQVILIAMLIDSRSTKFSEMMARLLPSRDSVDIACIGRRIEEAIGLLEIISRPPGGGFIREQWSSWQSKELSGESSALLMEEILDLRTDACARDALQGIRRDLLSGRLTYARAAQCIARGRSGLDLLAHNQVVGILEQGMRSGDADCRKALIAIGCGEGAIADEFLTTPERIVAQSRIEGCVGLSIVSEKQLAERDARGVLIIERGIQSGLSVMASHAIAYLAQNAQEPFLRWNVLSLGDWIAIARSSLLRAEIGSDPWPWFYSVIRLLPEGYALLDGCKGPKWDLILRHLADQGDYWGHWARLELATRDRLSPYVWELILERWTDSDPELGLWHGTMGFEREMVKYWIDNFGDLYWDRRVIYLNSILDVFECNTEAWIWPGHVGRGWIARDYLQWYWRRSAGNYRWSPALQRFLWLCAD
jgi:hypothetical protein